MGHQASSSMRYALRFMCTPQFIQRLGKGKTARKDPLTRESFIIGSRTGNSYPQRSRCTVGTGGPIEVSSKRRTLQTPELVTGENTNNNKNNTDGDHMPDWLREALQVCFLPPHRVLYCVTKTVEKGQRRLCASRAKDTLTLPIGESGYRLSEFRASPRLPHGCSHETWHL